MSLFRQAANVERGDVDRMTKIVEGRFWKFVGRWLTHTLRPVFGSSLAIRPTPQHRKTLCEASLSALLAQVYRSKTGLSSGNLILVLDWMDYFGAGLEERALVIEMMLPRLKRWDQTVVSALVRLPHGIEDFLSMARNSPDSYYHLSEFLRLLWYQGRDADMKMFLSELVSPDRPLPPEARSLIDAIVLISGSIEAAYSWLANRGIPAEQSRKWTDNNNKSWILLEHNLFTRYRPDGKTTNPLAR